jgi:hypothetical protein
VLKDNEVVLNKQRLFTRDIDKKSRVRLIQVVDGYSWQGLNGGQQKAVYA